MRFMKFRHLLAAFASFLLSACGGGAPSPSTQYEVDRLDKGADVLLDDDLANLDLENDISPSEISYEVSGDDDNKDVIVTPDPLEIERVVFVEDSYNDNKIASFSTKVYTKTEDRIKNLHIVCNRLSGTIIEPGEEFSYNDTCGPYNKENGFGKATVFINGEEAQEYGGGVCQLSSTLYNAIKGLNIEILERHNHSNEVYYVPTGEDATVSYGALDFRFKNNESFPIEIEAYSNENEVTVSIYKI